jgi:hydroxymethylglutaryl-CoA reductase
MQEKTISGFSKLTKQEKLRWLMEHFSEEPEKAEAELRQFWQADEEQQRVFDGFSENTISNYFLPYGIAPNFLINGKVYAVPMVIEESSVVAAASSAAKFWYQRGGFKAEVLATQKLGQVHFSWSGAPEKLKNAFPALKTRLREDARHITQNMEKRGGGVTSIDLVDMTAREEGYYQLQARFETCDSMGANFINSVLEEFGNSLKSFAADYPTFEGSERELEIIMAILSNYTPDCIARAQVECPIEDLSTACKGMPAEDFAQKFAKAVRIAEIDPYRAATHNKGIYNGVDAVVLATANDFRAIEACGHTFASRNGQYCSLSHCSLEDGIFRFWMDLPLAVGTVGGLTKLHPLARRSLELLGQPSAKELMAVIASTGLAQNFAAVRSLITTGIQQGHMKMHLLNILNHLSATQQEVEEAKNHFKDKVVSFTAVREYLKTYRRRRLVS